MIVFVNTKKVVVFPGVLCGANETSECSLGGGSSSSILFLIEAKYRPTKLPAFDEIFPHFSSVTTSRPHF